MSDDELVATMRVRVLDAEVVGMMQLLQRLAPGIPQKLGELMETVYRRGLTDGRAAERGVAP